MRAALTTNPSVQAQSAEARAALQELLQLRSEYDPVITLSGEAGGQRVNDPISLAPADNNTTKFTRELALEAEVTIFDGYRRSNLVYANAARVDGNIFRLLDASETMALNATEVYIDIVRHRRLLSVADRNVARHSEIVDRVIELVDAGRLPASDRFQAEDRLRAAELARVDIRRAVRDAIARYERVIGKTPTGSMSIPVVRGLPKSNDALIKTAVENSYRVRIKEIEVDRAGYEQAIVESDRMPRVTLNAGARTGRNIGGSSGNETDVFVGLRMNWTLYQGGRTAQSRALIERKSKAISERNVAVREVRELAERTWNAYLANGERARLLSRQLASNRQIVEQFISEFEAGKRTLLNVLEAERAAFDVEFQKVSAEAGYAFATYRLLAAQSLLAEHFGVPASDLALEPDFQARAVARPANVFRTEIPALE